MPPPDAGLAGDDLHVPVRAAPRHAQPGVAPCAPAPTETPTGAAGQSVATRPPPRDAEHRGTSRGGDGSDGARPLGGGCDRGAPERLGARHAAARGADTCTTLLAPLRAKEATSVRQASPGRCAPGPNRWHGP